MRIERSVVNFSVVIVRGTVSVITVTQQISLAQKRWEDSGLYSSPPTSQGNGRNVPSPLIGLINSCIVSEGSGLEEAERDGRTMMSGFERGCLCDRERRGEVEVRLNRLMRRLSVRSVRRYEVNSCSWRDKAWWLWWVCEGISFVSDSVVCVFA